MSANAKVEGYLINLGMTFEQIDENSWIINDDENGLERVAVITADPLLIIRVNVMGIPESKKEEFYKNSSPSTPRTSESPSPAIPARYDSTSPMSPSNRSMKRTVTTRCI